MDRQELLIDGIKGSKEILAELEDFAANEGHPNHQVMLAVLGEISRLKQSIAGMEKELELGPKMERDIHGWFGLTYASYLVVPRSVLQSMPADWQARLVQLLGELDDTRWNEKLPSDASYKVELRSHIYRRSGKTSWGGRIADPLCDYKRGSRNIFSE